MPEVAYNRDQLTQVLISHGLRHRAVYDDFRYDLTEWVGLPTRSGRGC